MKERPIIFGGEMVQAILEGRKTQTRRIVKPGPHSGMRWDSIVVNGYAGFTDGHGSPRPCPYGTEGDRLWVREAWNALYPMSGDMPWYHHELDKAGRDLLDAPTYFYRACDPSHVPTRDDIEVGFKWQSPIYMPRAASRILLEITGIRAQPLNCISEQDAWAEGVAPSDRSVTRYEGEGRNLFGKLWESIHGAESWFENPWVWIVEFKQVAQ